MFYNCINLESLNLNNFDTHNVIHMNNMFDNCKKIENLNLNSFETSSVEDMYFMFSGCKKLESLSLSFFTIKTSRVLPFRETTASPFLAASTVINCKLILLNLINKKNMERIRRYLKLRGHVLYKNFL